MMRLAATAVAALALGGVGAGAASAQALVIQGDTSIAGFLVKRDGSLGGAIDALGAPSSSRRTGETCLVRWRPLGIRMSFYNLGGGNPCGRRTGRFSNAVATGPRWRTGRGLRIGDSRARLRALYPRATFHQDRFYGAGWWLVTRRTQFGLPGTYPGLLARMLNRHVSGLVVRFPAGGD